MSWNFFQEMMHIIKRLQIIRFCGCHNTVNNCGRFGAMDRINHLRILFPIQKPWLGARYFAFTVVFYRIFTCPSLPPCLLYTSIWRERNVWYQGRSRQQVETEYEPCSNNEWREVSRGHSTKTVANVMGRTEL